MGIGPVLAATGDAIFVAGLPGALLAARRDLSQSLKLDNCGGCALALTRAALLVRGRVSRFWSRQIRSPPVPSPPTRIDEDVEVSLAELRSMITTNGAPWIVLLAGSSTPIRTWWSMETPESSTHRVGFGLARSSTTAPITAARVCTALTSFGLTPPDSTSGPSVKPPATRGR